MAFNIMLFQHAVYPESVEASFLHGHKRELATGSLFGFLAQKFEPFQQASNIASLQHMA